MTQSIAQTLINNWTGVDAPANTKEAYLEMLAQGVCTVEFQKVDGSQSVMDVTLNPALIPPAPPRDPNKPLKEAREPQDHLIHAYSPDRGGWRSFVVGNVNRFQRK